MDHSCEGPACGLSASPMRDMRPRANTASASLKNPNGPTETAQEFDLLFTNLDSLGVQLEHLENRVSPILSPSRPVADGVGIACPERESVLAGQVQSANQTLHRRIAYLMDIIERVQL